MIIVPLLSEIQRDFLRTFHRYPNNGTSIVCKLTGTGRSRNKGVAEERDKGALLAKRPSNRVNVALRR